MYLFGENFRSSLGVYDDSGNYQNELCDIYGKVKAEGDVENIKEHKSSRR